MIKKGINKVKGYLSFGKSSRSQALATSGEILGSFDQAIIGHIDDPADSTIERCQNCDQPTTNFYCANCGQSKTDMKRPIWYLISDFTDDLISPEGKLQKTIALLLFMPGALTRNFIDGKRVRYIPPIRFYLVSTLFFFLTMWVADVAVFKIEFKARDDEKVEDVRVASLAQIEELLRENSIELRSNTDSGEAPFLEPLENFEEAEDMEDVPQSPDRPNARRTINFGDGELSEEDIDQIIEEATREKEEVEAEQEALRQQGNNGGFDQERLDNQLARQELRREIRAALRTLTPNRGSGIEIVIPEGLPTEKLEQVSRQVEVYVDAYDIADGTGNAISHNGIRYNIEPAMFAPLAPSPDAVGLPAETFKDTQEDIVRSFDEGEEEILAELEQLRAVETTGLEEYLKLEKDLFFAEAQFNFMERVRGITLRAVDGLLVVSQDPQTLNRTLNDRMSQAMVILLPLFAFMTKFFYWGRENNLMKQLVFSLHFHSYIFIIMAILVIAQVIVGASVSTYMFVLAVPVYLFIAMKVASKQGWIKTIFKFFMVSVMYLVILFIVFSSTIIISLSDLAPSQRNSEASLAYERGLADSISTSDASVIEEEAASEGQNEGGSN